MCEKPILHLYHPTVGQHYLEQQAEIRISVLLHTLQLILARGAPREGQGVRGIALARATRAVPLAHRQRGGTSTTTMPASSNATATARP